MVEEKTCYKVSGEFNKDAEHFSIRRLDAQLQQTFQQSRRRGQVLNETWAGENCY
jgi:hypothetical protein